MKIQQTCVGIIEGTCLDMWTLKGTTLYWLSGEYLEIVY